ncbi:MAG: AMP-binding protein, partial [Candidatus Latescibacterota bacterium]
MSVETIPDLFLHSVTAYDKSDAFKYKAQGRYVDVSHRDMLAAVEKATRGILASQLATGDRIALMSENRLEWAIADLAILSAGCVNVPIYATLPANQVEFILRDSESRAVFVSNQDQYEKIRSIRDNLPHLLYVYSFDPIEGATDVLTLGDLM